MEILRTDNYSFTYAHAMSAALEEINLCLHPGEIILLAGDSGSGKSTLLKSLNGLIPEIVEGQLSGSRMLDGQDMDAMPIHEISRRVGSVFQNPRSQFFTLNATSELVFAMENYGFSRQEMDQRLEELKRLLPIAPLLGCDIPRLSSGERQLLAIASALALTPAVLLFDEPSANLDYANAMRLRPILQQLKAMGKTVLIADHRYYYLAGLIDRVLLVQGRRLTAFGSEAAFRHSGCDTRSFDLFSMELPFLPPAVKGDTVASLQGVSKWGLLRDISLDFRRHETAVLVGVNGAGKTTLARLLTGSVKPDKGTVKTCSLPFYVMQDADYQLFGTHVDSELNIGRRPVEEVRRTQVLEELNLLQYRSTHPFDLSGGEKQRLQIAVAAVSDADLIILDEPTSGLDVRSMERVVRAIRRLAEKRAVLIISHDYEFIRRVGQRIIHLREGRVAQDFPLTAERLQDFHQIFHQMEDTP